MEVEALYEWCQSSPQGISSATVQKNIWEHGYNILTVKKDIPIIFKFIKQFTNFFALLLIAGSLLAFFAENISPGEGNLYIGIALLGVVTLNAIFTFIQEYQSEKIMGTFKQMLPDPPRPEIYEAISKCKSADIRVIMMTGDCSLTAESIVGGIL